jgi:hypothetical protein
MIVTRDLPSNELAQMIKHPRRGGAKAIDHADDQSDGLGLPSGIEGESSQYTVNVIDLF